MVGINGEAAASRKNKVRVGVGQILILVLALVVVILISTARLIRRSDANKAGHKQGTVTQTSLVVPPPPGSSQHDAAASSAKNIASVAKINSFHFIVSSDCTSYQRWETLTQLHSAQSVHQCGRFTWIVSGW